jgi:hypothetical protein
VSTRAPRCSPLKAALNVLVAAEQALFYELTLASVEDEAITRGGTLEGTSSRGLRSPTPWWFGNVGSDNVEVVVAREGEAELLCHPHAGGVLW